MEHNNPNLNKQPNQNFSNQIIMGNTSTRAKEPESSENPPTSYGRDYGEGVLCTKNHGILCSFQEGKL
jgi:hypothetical protein